MKKSRGVLVLAILAVATVIMLKVGGIFSPVTSGDPTSAREAFDTTAPLNQEYQVVSSSLHFRVTATVRLGNVGPKGKRELVYDILVENKTAQPIRKILVGVTLDDAVTQVIETHMAEFGTAVDEKIDLVPGEIPKGLYVSRVAYVDDLDKMSASDRANMLTALKTPLLMKIQWQDGMEYLKIMPTDIVYTGF